MNILEIRNRLINDEIDYSVAFEEIKKFPKAWHTKDWEDKRQKVLKNYCEQCNSTEGVMVLQHLSHPPEFKTIRDEMFASLFTEILDSTILPKPVITSDDIKGFHEKNTGIREACPHCKWINIRKRKTKKPEYHCNSCKVDFEEAVPIEWSEVLKTSFPTDEEVTKYLLEKMEKDILWDFKRNIYAKYEKEIGKNALLISIDLHLKYMELENVVTFCKACAYRMDKQGKLLCWTCKTEYFDYRYECCYKCYEKNEVTKNPIKDMILKYREEYNNYYSQ